MHDATFDVDLEASKLDQEGSRTYSPARFSAVHPQGVIADQSCKAAAELRSL